MKKLLYLTTFVASTMFSYELTVHVENLRNNKGDVQFSVYNKPNSLPDEKFQKFYKQKRANIVNESSTITFQNLPKGTYAVNILHDENKNGKIDKGFMLPVEGVGLSNYSTINLFNRPNFKDASFLLDKNKSIDIKINYF